MPVPPALCAGLRALLQLAHACMQDDRMFMAEIGLMRKLSHPYIVRYHGCGVITHAQPNGGPPKHFIAVVSPPFPPSPRLGVSSAGSAICR